ncbi:arginase family protein [Vibrio sp. ZSDE26]|uniref:Arginase family protein n=1 Tax=Vibrio amylolyticus TaxID=2847292 RepID=A0A9X1XS52_9VIBR|nr:arginase family protein [Vibrio amylolyticus]MCK6264579.1 arginase family protein [Vibrio amylolyticus]
MKKKFDIIGAPFNLLGCHPSTENTVDGLRKLNEQSWIGLTDWIHVRNTRWNRDIQDVGDIDASPEVINLIEQDKKEQALALYCEKLQARIEQTLESGRVPITIGGDHSIGLGTVQAILTHYQKNRNEKVAIVWVDAHADCNDSLASNLHGKPLALLMDRYPHHDWSVETEITLSADDIYYVAVRDLMLNEHQLISSLGITNHSMQEIDERGFSTVLNDLMTKLERDYDRIYLSFDYDALDGATFRACGTPNVGGLTAREAITLVHTLSRSAKFVGADFVEYLPSLDKDGVSKELMIKLIDAAWGLRA